MFVDIFDRLDAVMMMFANYFFVFAFIVNNLVVVVIVVLVLVDSIGMVAFVVVLGLAIMALVDTFFILLNELNFAIYLFNFALVD